ncbi:hypothetical protein THRCLA_09996, partial [Thraustotheca clavata]
MGRHRDPLWKWFDETPVQRPGKITACVTCKFCGNHVCAVTTSLKRHLEICRKRDTTLLPDHDLPLVDVHHKRRLPAEEASSASYKRPAPAEPPVASTSTSASTAKKQERDKLLARAFLRSSTTPAVVKNPSFLDFIKSLAPNYVVPAINDIFGGLLDAEYTMEMDAIRSQLTSTGAGMLSLHASRKFCMLFTPLPFAVPVLSSCAPQDNAQAITTDIIAARRATRAFITSQLAGDSNEIFSMERSSLPFLSFCGNGSPLMPTIRTMLDSEQSNDSFDFTYGNLSIALHHVCRDICALLGPKTLIKRVLILLYYFKHHESLKKLFATTCHDARRENASLPKYFDTGRFASIVDMLTQLSDFRSIFSSMAASVANNESLHMNLNPTLASILYDSVLWKSVIALIDVLKPISEAIRYLEGSEATFSSAYAIYLHLKIHFLDIPNGLYSSIGVDLSQQDCKRDIVNILSHHVSSIYTPVHALAFRCDPFYDGLRNYISSKYDANFLNLNEEFLSECRAGIAHLCRKSKSQESKVLSQFCLYCARTSMVQDVFTVTKAMLPNCIWSQ